MPFPTWRGVVSLSIRFDRRTLNWERMPRLEKMLSGQSRVINGFNGLATYLSILARPRSGRTRATNKAAMITMMGLVNHPKLPYKCETLSNLWLTGLEWRGLSSFLLASLLGSRVKRSPTTAVSTFIWRPKRPAMMLAQNRTLVAVTRHAIPRDGRFVENYPSATGNMKSFSEHMNVQ